MSKISIKTDFADGDKLFAQELNNNFSVIEAGINANEENLQEVIDQAIEELDEELEEITADRGWDWNGGDRVTFFKGNTSAISGKAVTNGQLLYNTDTGETALDDNNTRIVTGSGNVISVADSAPTNLATKEWIKPVTVDGVATAEEYFRNSSNNWVKILCPPSGDTLPVASVVEFSDTTAPTNWLFCNGQALSRTDYAELYAIIGTTYGEGDGSTTFNLPDYEAISPTGVEPSLSASSIIKVKQSVGIVGTVTTDISDSSADAVPNASTVKSYTDNLKAVTLFNDAEGSRGTINLSDSAANYSRIDIEFLMESQYDSTTMYSPNGKKAILSTAYMTTGGWYQISSEDVTISGNQITRGSRYYANISAQGNVDRGTASGSTLITKVVGYK